MAINKSKWRRRLEFISLFVIPYSIALINGKRDPYGTSVAIALFWAAFPVMFVWLTFDSEASSVLLPDSILRKKIKERTIAKADIIFRVLIIAGSLAVLFFITGPLCIDVYELFQHGNAVSGEFKIPGNRSPIPGTWFLFQMITLEEKERESFPFMLSPEMVLKVHHKYRLTILPRSRVIVSAQRLE